MKPITMLAAATLLATGAAAMAQERHNRPTPMPGPGWTTIGYTTVGAGRDRDVIRVRGNDRHRQIRVCALNRAIEMRDLDVRFANGVRQDIAVRQIIRAGSCTAAKDLRGQRRNLQSVSIAYSRLRGVMPIVRIQAR
jgi:hypothetical protein